MNRIESVHNANDTAIRASAGILDQDPPTIQVPSFWPDQYDVALQSVGTSFAESSDLHQVVRKGKQHGSISFWTFKSNNLIFVEAIRDPESLMLGKKCLQQKKTPDPNSIINLGYDPFLDCC